MRRTLGATVLTLLLTAAVVAAPATAATRPSATTGNATANLQAATLRGTVNPNGAATDYYFQWGKTAAYGARSATQSAGNGTKAVNVHTDVTGLDVGTTYHYRIVASNANGTTIGADRTFTTLGATPPDATTGPASYVGTNSAVVTGTINPRGAPTSYGFDYGTSTAYTAHTPWHSAPAGNSPVPVSFHLPGLASGTIYHYRLVARHGTSIVSYGGDQQFMTHPSPRPVPSVHARTRPRRDHQRPFAFTTRGRVAGPASIPATYACTGRVRIRWFLGHRRIRQAIVPLRPDCTFAVRTVFGRRPGHQPRTSPVRLRVSATFLGNAYLAPARTPRAARVTLQP